jgi:hypothetical protein
MRLVAVVATVMLTTLIGGPALADSLLIDKTSDLKNASPATEQAWLEKLLGGTSLTLVAESYAANVDWDYAVTKTAKLWAAYADTANDKVLTVPGLSTDHIRYFKVPGPSSRVPEPSALLLLGVGLAAAAPFAWSRRRRT